MTDLMFQSYLIVFGVVGSLLSIGIIKTDGKGFGTLLVLFLVSLIYGVASLVFGLPIPDARLLAVLFLTLVTLYTGFKAINCFTRWLKIKGRSACLTQQRKVAKKYGIEQ